GLFVCAAVLSYQFSVSTSRLRTENRELRTCFGTIECLHPYNTVYESVSSGGAAMFCDQCGAQLQAGESRCGRCGKTVLGLIELRRSRVRDHVRLVGILWMAYSALHVVAGVVVIVIAQTIFGHVIRIPNGPPPEITVWLRPLISFVGWLILAKAAAGFVAGGVCCSGRGGRESSPWSWASWRC